MLRQGRRCVCIQASLVIMGTATSVNVTHSAPGRKVVEDPPALQSRKSELAASKQVLTP